MAWSRHRGHLQRRTAPDGLKRPTAAPERFKRLGAPRNLRHKHHTTHTHTQTTQTAHTAQTTHKRHAHTNHTQTARTSQTTHKHIRCQIKTARQKDVGSRYSHCSPTQDDPPSAGSDNPDGSADPSRSPMNTAPIERPGTSETLDDLAQSELGRLHQEVSTTMHRLVSKARGLHPGSVADADRERYLARLRSGERYRSSPDGKHGAQATIEQGARI